MKWKSGITRRALGPLVAAGLAMCLATCGGGGNTSVPEPAPSVYYWRTALRLDSTERAFLARHRIGKIYLRMFDVVVRDGRCIPAGTLTFHDALPGTISIIPVVFLTEECLHADTAGLAANIVERVRKMVRANKLSGVRELQIDCDWKPSSREAYYALLTGIRSQLAASGRAENGKAWKLSATLRLHQLSQPAPPADYAALMLYNTGDFTHRNSRNPIFDQEDIEPYLPHLKNYPLPLCAAYPNFRWQRLFDGESFKGLLYSENLGDSTVYEPTEDDSLYRVVQGRTLHGSLQGDYDIHLSPGNEVVVSRPRAEEVLALAHRMQKVRRGIHSQVIFYHLDHNFLNTYNSEQYEAFYHLR